MIPHDYLAISSSTLADVAELLGLDPNEVGSLIITPERVLVTGRPGTTPLLLPVVADV